MNVHSDVVKNEPVEVQTGNGLPQLMPKLELERPRGHRMPSESVGAGFACVSRVRWPSVIGWKTSLPKEKW